MKCLKSHCIAHCVEISVLFSACAVDAFCRLSLTFSNTRLRMMVSDFI